jgi:hypothetical protein
MEIEFTCPSCNKAFNIEYDGEGGIADCPFCNAMLEFEPPHPSAPTRRVAAKLRHPPSHGGSHIPHKPIPHAKEQPQSSGSLAEVMMWVAVIVVGGGGAWWWLKNRAETPPPSYAPVTIVVTTAPPPRAAAPAPTPSAPPASQRQTPPSVPAPVPEPAAAESTTPAFSLPNAGFEKTLEGWQIGRSAGLIRVMTGAAHTGNRGLRVADDSAERDSIVTQSFRAEPGAKYECKFWARMISGDGVKVALRFTVGDGQPAETSVEIPADTKEWKEFAVTGTAPERATGGEIWIATTEDKKAVADFDDFQLGQGR